MSVPTTTVVIGSPFKGLSPFADSELDAQLFFGRDRETEIVVANLLASRLTVLYGPSGVGKSSLLRAGVAQSLRRLQDTEPPAVALFSSWSSEPLAGIEEAARAGVAEALGADPGDAPGSLGDRVDAWTSVLGGELCLILDQLEEFFLYHDEGAGTAAFGEALAELVTRPRLRVNVLLGIRDDALARLDTFKARIPILFANSLRLDRLDRAAAEAAVLGPLAHYNELAVEDERVSIEPVLLAAVLDEVAAGRIDSGLAGRGGVEERSDGARIETPYLQLVMQRLWEVERERGSGVLRLATFRELGGAQRIVEDHLDRAMAALTPPQREVAAGMFDHLVTPSGMKVAHGVDDLASYARVREGDVVPVVASLAGQRILRPLGEEGGGHDRYEIFHDVLAGAVLAWCNRYEAERAVQRVREQSHRRQRRLAAIAGLLVAALAVMIALTAYAFSQRSEAREQAALAEQQQANADAQASAAKAAQQRAEASEETAKAATATAKDQQRVAESARKDALRQGEVARHEKLLATSAATRAEASRLDAQRQAAAAKTAQGQAEQSEKQAQQSATEATQAKEDAQQQATRATRARLAAESQKRIAQTQALTAQAVALLDRDPDQSLNLVVDAAEKGSTKALEDAARGALLASRVRAIYPAGAGSVEAAQTSADGGVLFAAGSGGEADVYDLRAAARTTSSRAAGRRVTRLRHGAEVTAAALAPDGRTAATAGTDGRIVIWNVPGGTRRARVAYPDAVRTLAFSPDGSLLAAAASDGSALVWRAADGHLLHRLPSPRPATAASFSPDGKRLLVVAGDARIFDLATGVVLATLDQPGDINAARFSPAGTLVATGGRDDRAFVWDAGTGVRLHELTGHGGDVLAIAWSPDGRFVATGCSDSGARIYRADSGGGPLALLPRHVNHVVSVAFSPDGAALVSGSLDGTAWLWSGPLFARAISLRGHDGAVTTVGFTPDGRRALTAGEDGSVRLWINRADPELVGRAKHAAAARAVAVSADGRLLVTASLDRTAVIRRRNGAPLWTLPHPTGVTAAAFSRDGKLVLTGAEDGIARLWRVRDGRILRQFFHGAAVTGVAFGPRADTFATAGADGIADLWRTAGGREPIRLYRHGGGPLGGVAISPDGRTVATAGADDDGRVWRLADGRLLGKLSGHTDVLTSIEYSPDGTLLLTASVDASMRLWNARTHRQVRVIRGHSAVVSDAAFSPDGRWIASAGPVTVGLWETSTGQRLEVGGPLLFLRGNTRRVRSVAFAEDGRIAAVADDGSLRTYDCEICGRLDSLVRLAKRRLATVGSGLTAADRRRYLGR